MKEVLITALQTPELSKPYKIKCVPNNYSYITND